MCESKTSILSRAFTAENVWFKSWCYMSNPSYLDLSPEAHQCLFFFREMPICLLRFCWTSANIHPSPPAAQQSGKISFLPLTRQTKRHQYNSPNNWKPLQKSMLEEDTQHHPGHLEQPGSGTAFPQKMLLCWALHPIPLAFHLPIYTTIKFVFCTPCYTACFRGFSSYVHALRPVYTGNDLFHTYSYS